MSRSPDSIAIGQARSIIHRWGIQHPSEIMLEEIAADLNAIVVERPNIGSVARIISLGENALITVDSQIREVGRKRFAIAHELGHFVLHRKRSPIEICTEASFFQWYKNTTEEEEANTFAVELLMPAELFITLCGNKQPSLKEIARIAEEFQTSLSATAIRYIEYGKTPSAIIAANQGKISWYAVHRSFPYRVKGKGSPLHEFSCANDYFAKGDAPTEAETVLGIAWLEDPDIGGKCYLFEEVIPLKAYDTTLSLIWIRQDDNSSDHSQFPPSHFDPDHFTPDGKRYRW